MNTGMQTAAYLAAIILFIKSLGGLARQETAKHGNWYGVLGMLIAVLATLAGPSIQGVGYMLVAFLLAAILGFTVALKVEMTQMPQLVAALHSFVGLAAVLVGFGSYLEPGSMATTAGPAHLIHLVEVYLGIFIGQITLTGSLVAFGKLQGTISGKPLVYPGRHLVNLAIIIASIGLGYFFVVAPGLEEGIITLLVMTALAGLLGVFMVTAIGGADMPVVVSMLNSYSGWAASAAGFMLKNDLLIVTGALVGSSGAILSYIMCKAMNRSFVSVILGGFGTGAGKGKASSVNASNSATQEAAQAVNVEETASLLKNAKSVVIIPGYGMAVAKAQYPIYEMAKLLQQRGIQVRFAIHPVAGRLPGHMNVLLAEARVPYDIVLEMDEINDDLARTDVALIVGANDTVNPGAQDDPSSPIYGMPVIRAWEAKTVVISKRSMASGYAGVPNPLFHKENSKMLFGDAKQTIEAVVVALRQ